MVLMKVLIKKKKKKKLLQVFSSVLESWSVCSTSCVHSENTALITHSRTAVTAAPPAGWLAARGMNDW